MLLTPLTPMSLVVSMRWPPAKWSPVSWCSERTIENLSVMLGLLGVKLGDVEAGHARADRLPDAAILGRGVRLHVVHVHVARAAVEPDQDDRGVLGVPSGEWLMCVVGAAGRAWASRAPPCRRRRA